MLTGRQGFQGRTVSDILASVLARDLDFSLLSPKLNPKVVQLIRRATEKEPRRRWQAVGDMRVETEAVIADGAFSEGSGAKPRALWKRAVPVVLALLMGSVLTALAFWKMQPTPTLPVSRFAVALPEGQNFTNISRNVVAISPDGNQIVYSADQRLYHRNLSELDVRPIPGTETWQGVANPVFSPDGHSIVFAAQSDRTFKKIAVTGGATVTLCPIATDGSFGMSWGKDGIVFGAGTGGIMKVSENGGKPELLVSSEKGELLYGPQVLPGGEAILYTASTGASATDLWDKAKIYVQPLKGGGARKLVVDGGTDGRYVSTGHIVYAYQGTLFAVPFDLRRLQVTGGQAPVVEGVRRSGGGSTGAAHFSFSQTGTLIYISGPVSVGSAGTDGTLAAIDLKGGIERLKLSGKSYAFPRVSPDGKQVAVSTDGKDANVWIVDLAGATAPRQLTLVGANRYPVWSADSKRVAFQSDREGDLGIFWQNADGTGTAERLTKPDQGAEHIPDSWSPDNKRFSYTAVKGREAALWIFNLQDKKSTVFAEKPGAFIGRSAFSPDGQWLAYQSNETGTVRSEIFVQPFPATGAKYPVAKVGHPFWSPDGLSLFYNPDINQIESVGIITKPTFSFKQPVRPPGGLMGLRSRAPTAFPRVWDFTPDGKHIIGVIDVGNPEQTTSAAAGGSQIQIVLNWFTELQQRVPVK
jgi:serine/threonine-protein kinase